MTKISIHRALTELKTIDARISKAIQEFKPTGIKQKQKGKLVDNKFEEAMFEKTAAQSFQSITDLLKQKNVIKTAVVLSNSKTLVKIAGTEMTVADAITMKASIGYNQLLVDQMKASLRKSQSDLERVNVEVERRKDELIKATFGKDNLKTKAEDVEAMSKNFDDNNSYEIVNPLGVETKISMFETSISEFLTDVDAVLSETNATTFIEI